MNAPLDKLTRTSITKLGMVKIPQDVRDAIGLVPGQPVDVGLNERGEVVVMPIAMPVSNETPEERSARIMAALDRASLRHRTGRPVDEMMAELRGDEPLP